jgi:hypothetical protein
MVLDVHRRLHIPVTHLDHLLVHFIVVNLEFLNRRIFTFRKSIASRIVLRNASYCGVKLRFRVLESITVIRCRELRNGVSPLSTIRT